MNDTQSLPQPDISLHGVKIFKRYLDRAAQLALVEQVREVVRVAPLFSPDTPEGQRMRVRMTSAGACGWYSDARGYRYIDRHPTGHVWPPIPEIARRVWDEVIGGPREPESCLVNFYSEGTRMGLHQDKDEADSSCSVLSISLGDDGLFRVGGSTRAAPTGTLWLNSGDVAVIGGDARLAYHGVDRIRFGSSTLLREGGRLNLTLRVVSGCPLNSSQTEPNRPPGSG